MIDLKLDEKLNDFLIYKEKYFKDDCILDALESYAFSKDLDSEILARELSENEGFVEIVRKDLIKFKFIKEKENNELDKWS